MSSSVVPRPLVVALGIALAAAACGGVGSSVPASTTSEASPATAGPGGGHASAATPTSAATPALAAPVSVDPTLLEVLPPDIDGRAIEFSSEGSNAAAADPGVAIAAEAVGYGVAGDRATGDLVVVAVTRLKPGVFGDAFFRGWRDSYDEAVCASSGGVSGNAEAELAGRPVHIGTCAENGRTYHAWLGRRRVVVSAFSVGDERLGEQVMVALRE